MTKGRRTRSDKSEKIRVLKREFFQAEDISVPLSHSVTKLGITALDAVEVYIASVDSPESEQSKRTALWISLTDEEILTVLAKVPKFQ